MAMNPLLMAYVQRLLSDRGASGDAYLGGSPTFDEMQGGGSMYLGGSPTFNELDPFVSTFGQMPAAMTDPTQGYLATRAAQQQAAGVQPQPMPNQGGMARGPLPQAQGPYNVPGRGLNNPPPARPTMMSHMGMGGQVNKTGGRLSPGQLALLMQQRRQGAMQQQPIRRPQAVGSWSGIAPTRGG